MYFRYWNPVNSWTFLFLVTGSGQGSDCPGHESGDIPVRCEEAAARRPAISEGQWRNLTRAVQGTYVVASVRDSTQPGWKTATLSLVVCARDNTLVLRGLLQVRSYLPQESLRK